jgi:hypothetical protein
MKRKILTLITCTSLVAMALSACGSTANEISTDVVGEEAQTVVSESSTEENSTVEETTTEAVGMETVYLLSKQTYYDENGDVEFYEEYEYDDNGNNISVKWYSDGMMSSFDTYEYDSNGNMIKLIYTYENEESVFLYEYDSNGTETRSTRYSGDIILEDNYYDSYGNIIDDFIYDDDGTLDYEMITDNEYDANGNLLKAKSYFSDDSESIIELMEYEYDDNGNCVVEIFRLGDESSTPYSTTENEYDLNGNMIKRTVTNYKGFVDELEENEYNADGKILSNKYTSYNDGVVDEEYSYSSQYTYDANGNEISYISYNLDGSFDSHCECEYIAIEVPVE